AVLRERIDAEVGAVLRAALEVQLVRERRGGPAADRQRNGGKRPGRGERAARVGGERRRIAGARAEVDVGGGGAIDLAAQVPLPGGRGLHEVHREHVRVA